MGVTRARPEDWKPLLLLAVVFAIPVVIIGSCAWRDISAKEAVEDQHQRELEARDAALFARMDNIKERLRASSPKTVAEAMHVMGADARCVRTGRANSHVFLACWTIPEDPEPVCVNFGVPSEPLAGMPGDGRCDAVPAFLSATISAQFNIPYDDYTPIAKSKKYGPYGPRARRY